jgi:hypothetical protein
MTTPVPPAFEERLAQIEQIAVAVAKFDNPELQVEAYKFLIGSPSTPARQKTGAPASGDAKSGAHEPSGEAGQTNGSTKRRSAGKKQTLTFDKSIDFYSSSGDLQIPLKEFTEAHPAKSALQKAVVVVYWLTKELQLAPLTVDHVYSAFKTLSWPVPANLLNTLQKAGSENYLDTKKSADIKITTHGENLVEHSLKPAPAP